MPFPLQPPPPHSSLVKQIKYISFTKPRDLIVISQSKNCEKKNFQEYLKFQVLKYHNQNYESSQKFTID